jgi:hypothetical protein
MGKPLIALAAVAVLVPGTPAQPPDAIVSWSFDDGVGAFQGPDPASAISTTADANVVRGAEHGAVLECAYTPSPGQLAGVYGPAEADLTAAKSVRFWVRSSEPALVLVAMDEADGSSYHSGFMSLPDTWQEVALGLPEFRLGEDSTDENGRLDPGQVQGVGILDATGFIAQLAEQAPFLLAPELTPRMLWLDDLALSSESVPPRWSETEVDGNRAVRLDSFEVAPLEWMALAGSGLEVSYDPDFKAEGDLSLRLRYDLPAGKIVGLLTSPQGPDLKAMKHLSLALMTETATTLIVTLKERDESEYHLMVDLQPTDGLQSHDLTLAQFTLGDDKTDENGRLDLDQVTELSLADVSAMAGNAVVNTLWVDEVVFAE